MAKKRVEVREIRKKCPFECLDEREQATTASHCHLWGDDDKIFGELMVVVVVRGMKENYLSIIPVCQRAKHVRAARI